MKDSLHDKVLNKLLERRRQVQVKLHQQYKGVKPFRQEQVPPKLQQFNYEQMTPEDMQYVISQYGREDVNEWIKEMEQKKLRSQQNGGT